MAVKLVSYSIESFCDDARSLMNTIHNHRIYYYHKHSKLRVRSNVFIRFSNQTSTIAFWLIVKPEKMANPEKWIPIISISLIILQLVSGEVDQNNNMLVNIFYSIALGTGIYFLKNLYWYSFSL